MHPGTHLTVDQEYFKIFKKSLCIEMHRSFLVIISYTIELNNDFHIALALWIF